MQELFIENHFDELKSYIESIDKQKIFLVIDKGSYQISGAKKFIEKRLQLSTDAIFSDFNSNPEIKDLEKGIELFKSAKYELIIAIGGGSVLDMAKLISLMSHQTALISSITKGESPIKNTKTELLAIPTTAGTGAEATAFSVLYIGKVKYSVASPYILPDSVYLSSEFSMSAPAYLTASTGLDAFSQAIESLWSVSANEESEAYSLEAIDLVWKNLKKAVLDNDTEAKSKMQEAAFLAGKAINITKTTAPHALSYAFTSYYNIPHGHAVCLSLAFFLEYNYKLSDKDCTDPRGAQHVKQRINKIIKILDVDINDVDATLDPFYESIGINTKISSLIKDFDSKLIVGNVNLERLSNNPRQIDEQTILNFFNN